MSQDQGQRRGARSGRGERQRLWVVSELYFPEQTSTGYFLTRIAEGLAADFDVRVICGQPTYSEHGLRAPTFETRAGTHIHRMRATRFPKDRLVLRAINALTFTLAVQWFALRKFRAGDEVLVVTNPPTVPIAAGVAARLRGARATLLVHDLYPEFLAATGMMRRASRRYRMLAALFSRVYRLFGRIVVLGRDMKEVVALKMGGDARRLSIIPKWADLDEVRPIAPAENNFRREHGLDGRFVVQFSGNIGRSHDVEVLLDAARLLRDDAAIIFLFVGYGGKSGIVAEAEREGLANVRFLPRQPRERLGEMLAASDVTIIPFVSGMYGISVPSRMYNIMAAGVPIVAVADPTSELALTVAEEGAGWVLPGGDAPALAELIRRLAGGEGRAEAVRRGAAGRAAASSRYRLDQVLDAYRSLFREAPVES